MPHFGDLALGASLLDLTLTVLSGGVSLVGPAGAGGFLARVAFATALVLTRRRFRWAIRGYVVLLLLLLPLLQFRGYRLRGDGLWYYSYAHSLAFDRDVSLLNQYERLGIEKERGSQVVPYTGYARSTFPVGVGFLWAPLLGAGLAGAFWRNVFGLETSYDGWSDPFFHSVALGSLVLGWLGLLVLDRFLRRWFAPGVAFAATVATALGTFLLWYLTYHSAYTHAPTFLLSALALEIWVASRSAPVRAVPMGLLGLVIGLAALVRWQNGILALLSFASFFEGASLTRDWKKALVPGLSAGAGFLLGFTPQIVVWKLIFGSFLIGVPLGESYMRWGSPFLSEVLFSSRHGLFSWSPLLFFATAGLLGFVRREKRVGLILAALLALDLYVNSAVADWWAGGSFGARRFDAALPIFAVGLATAIEWAIGISRRWPALLPAGVLATFVVGNVVFMEQYRKGRIPTDDTLSYEAAGRAMMEDVFDWVGYPFSFPANWAFALRYGRPKTQYDLLVGKYLFHLQNNLGGVIDLGEKDAPFVGNGWSSVSDWPARPREIRFAQGGRAGVFVPTDAPATLRVFIECAAPEGTAPSFVVVSLNGNRIGSFESRKEMTEHMLVAEASLWQRINLLELAPAAKGEGRFLAVDRIRFERVETER